MVCWLKNQFTDFWMYPDVIDAASQFANEISSSDDPPETLPISEIMELKETMDYLCDRFHPPELPQSYPLRLYDEHKISFSEVSPAELAEELTLMLSEKFCQLTSMDFALFYQNEDIILSCPLIVDYYETIDKVNSFF